MPGVITRTHAKNITITDCVNARLHLIERYSAPEAMLILVRSVSQSSPGFGFDPLSGIPLPSTHSDRGLKGPGHSLSFLSTYRTIPNTPSIIRYITMFRRSIFSTTPKEKNEQFSERHLAEKYKRTDKEFCKSIY